MNIKEWFLSWMTPLFMFCSCNGMDYAVTVENVGESSIWVDTFELYQGAPGRKSEGKVGVGILPPSISATSMSFTKKPNNEVKLTWKNKKTGEISSTTVALKIPKEFWKKLLHNKIIIHLNPDAKKAKVIYAGYKIAEDKDYYIDSEGKPYKLKKFGVSP